MRESWIPSKSWSDETGWISCVAMPKGGKPKDKRGGGQKMAYRDERDVSEEEEEEEEEKVTSKSAPRQNPKAGMMPPSDDDEDDDDEEEKPVARQNPNAGKMPPAGGDNDDDDDGPSEIDRLKVIFNKCKVPQEIKRELAISLLAWKKNEDIKQKAQPPRKSRRSRTMTTTTTTTTMTSPIPQSRRSWRRFASGAKCRRSSASRRTDGIG